MRKELMRFKRIWMHKHFFQSKMFLDISKEEEDTETALIDQTVNQMKGTN